jgi:hypothetical protein
MSNDGEGAQSRKRDCGCPWFIHWPFEDCPACNGVVHGFCVIGLLALASLARWFL